MKKTVLITGGSRGIGAQAAHIYAQHGFNVAINYYKSSNEANKLKEELQKEYNTDVVIIKCDISKEEEVKNMVNEVISKFNRIDVLVNNAGIAIDTLYEDKTVDNFKRTLDVNLIGPFLVSKYVCEHMKKEGTGCVINVASTNGIDTYYPMSVDYDASKAGLISLSHNMAVEYAPIRVNAVAPGWVNTDMNKELDQDFIKDECKKILLNRFADPKEIANVIYFLSSDEASYINNTVIRIDGGFYA